MNKYKGLPQIQIGDIIIVKHKKDSKIFELEDIACWEKNHSIKTIGMVEKKLKSWNFETKKQLKSEIKRLTKKAKYIIKNNENVLINCKHDSVPYNVSFWFGNSYNPDEITSVSFQKMMLT